MFHDPDEWYIAESLDRLRKRFDMAPGTAMPKLPVGWAWRVSWKVDDFYGSYLVVDAIRFRKRLRPKLMSRESTYRTILDPAHNYYDSDHPFASMPSTEIVLRLALKIVYDNDLRLKARAAQDKFNSDAASVVGTYPPKSLT